MKKIVTTVIILFLTSSLFSLTHAQTLPSSDDMDKINEKVDELKDKVASRVAELNLVEKKGIVGVVEKVSSNQITINDLKNKTRIIDIDEITKFSSNENSSYELSDIKKGSQISALGLYNKDSRRLLARFVNEVSIPLFVSGVVTSVNEENFTITLTTQEEKKYIIDIERVTKTLIYKDGDLTSSGFSKISPGENTIVSGFENLKEKNRITASRLIIFSNIPQNPNVKAALQSLSPTPTPND